MDHWREIVENGAHELRRDFDGMTLTISKLDIPCAWACLLPDGKRIVGELQIVRETVERIMSSRISSKSSAT
jgi:hypothetical protein